MASKFNVAGDPRRTNADACAGRAHLASNLRFRRRFFELSGLQHLLHLQHHLGSWARFWSRDSEVALATRLTELPAHQRSASTTR